MNDADALVAFAPTFAADTPMQRIAPLAATDVLPAANTGHALRYEPIATLGQGGMGEVRVWRDRQLGRDLAVKIAHRQLGASGKLRFAREASLQARLEHPAFVPVYDVGTDADGEPYFTMRRVKGRTLREVLRASLDRTEGGETLGLHRLLGVFTQLCLAIDYAHRRGVVHRDIKPENVMLGDFGEVYLLDWGIAKVLEETEADTTSLQSLLGGPQGATAHGSILGTPGYMAPEQLRGENSSLDGRADVYALGALLFEMLTYVPLNQGATFADLVVATLAGDDRSPARRAPDRGIAADLDAIVVRATALDRADRFASARELADAVERHLDLERDTAARRAKAEELATSASQKLDASGDDLEQRAEAGRRAVRALAFDPGQSTARRVLLRVLGESPPKPPQAAVEAVEAARIHAEQVALRSGAVNSLAGSVFNAVVAWGLFGLAGVRSLFGAIALMFLGGLILFRESARPKTSDGAYAAAALCFVVSCSLFMRFYSPFVSVPTTVTAGLLIVSIYASRWRRYVLGLAATATLTVPYALERIGAISPTWIATGTEVRIVSRVTSGPPPAWLILSASVVIVIGVARAVFSAVDEARRVELRRESGQWMLRRVLDET